MRVLMVTNPLPTAAEPGTMAPVARQIESLRALGTHVDVLELRGPRKLKYLQAFGPLWSLARPVDLIHAHFGYCGWLARCRFDRPVVLSFMGDDLLGTADDTGRFSAFSRFIVQVDRWVARTVDAVIVKSAEMARVVAPVRAHVIPNGVDLHTFRPIERSVARAELGLDDVGRYVLFPGRPDDRNKNHALAQAAVRESARRLAEPVELIPLQEVAHHRVPLYMNACDAMVLTSFSEGSPNVVKEAMACNLPVVSVPVGDVAELLADVSGCAICSRDATVLGTALEEILMRRQRTESRAVLQRKGLDQESVARKLMTVYSDVLAQRRTLSRCVA